jgi:DNA-binding winged helix-turn-helix (wHTH) protein
MVIDWRLCGGGRIRRSRLVTYEFDRFRLDSEARQLRRDGAELHLSPKAFELLMVLVENCDRAMSRSDLHTHLWPTTYVLETNLASLIAEIRRVLEDSADKPRFVRTMHRFGYRFVGDLRVASVAVAAPGPAIRCWLLSEARQVPLQQGDNIVGRAPDAAVWIDAAGVSRHHALIVVAGSTATVKDLESKNGTFVGNHQVTASHPLEDGDQIRLGPVVLTFRVPSEVGATDSVRPS